ncbi:MAG: NUDIX hydrolase [Anaerolineaceae bacterium]|nr:NUDIX hydrolase [Anaerolineaceae bacterium]
MHPAPWKVLSSHYIAQNYWISIRADRCETPGGYLVDPYFVLEYRPWVNVVALTPELQVVMVRQYRHAIGTTVLELPGGMLDPQDSSPLDAMRRELLEETGYAAESWLETGIVSPNPASHTNPAYSFLATGAFPAVQPHPDDTEEIEVVLLPLEEVIHKALASELVQSLHITALFFALDRLGRLST